MWQVQGVQSEHLCSWRRIRNKCRIWSIGFKQVLNMDVWVLGRGACQHHLCLEVIFVPSHNPIFIEYIIKAYLRFLFNVPEVLDFQIYFKRVHQTIIVHSSKVGLIERRLFQEVADEFCINTDKLFKDLTRTIKKNIKAGWNVSHLLQKIYYIQKLSWCAINIYIQKHHIQKGQFWVVIFLFLNIQKYSLSWWIETKRYWYAWDQSIWNCVTLDTMHSFAHL